MDHDPYFSFLQIFHSMVMMAKFEAIIEVMLMGCEILTIAYACLVQVFEAPVFEVETRPVVTLGSGEASGGLLAVTRFSHKTY